MLRRRINFRSRMYTDAESMPPDDQRLRWSLGLLGLVSNRSHQLHMFFKVQSSSALYFAVLRRRSPQFRPQTLNDGAVVDPVCFAGHRRSWCSYGGGSKDPVMHNTIMADCSSYLLTEHGLSIDWQSDILYCQIIRATPLVVA